MMYSCEGIEYSLMRSDRKTVSIYVEPNGSVLIRAPTEIAVDRINNIITNKKLWIYKALAEFQELNHTKVKRKIANGEGFLFLGNNLRLKLEYNLKEPISISNGYFLLDENHADRARELFVKFYKEQGKNIYLKGLNTLRKNLGSDREK